MGSLLSLALGCGTEGPWDESISTVQQEVTASSRVIVNQIGYVSNLKKIASVTGSGCNGKTFWVKSGSTNVFTGTTSAAVTDPGSGEIVCKADFTNYTTTGTFSLQVDGIATSDPFVITSNGAGLYSANMYRNTVYYFTYHRLGTVNVDITLPGSKGTNVSRNWTARANTTLGAYNNWTGGTFSIDGAHMDAGDLGMYADAAAQSMWGLMNLQEFGAPTTSLSLLPDGTKDLISEIVYGTKFMHGLLPADSSQLAAHKCHDVSWATQPWPFTGGNESNRYCMGPSSTATYSVARSLAQLVRIAGTRLGSNESTYWNRAKEAWSRVQGKDGQVFDPNNSAHSPGFAEGGGPYNDEHAGDDRFAAAVELFLTQKARGESLTSAYVNTVNSTATNCRHNSRPSGNAIRCLGSLSYRYMDWEADYTQANLSLMAYHLKVGGNCSSSSCSGGISGDVPDLHLVRNGIVTAANSALSTIAANGYPTPIAGTDYPWGSNKVVAHAMMILGYAHRLTGSSDYLSGMHQSMDYLLGQNFHRKSFVTGYGTRFVQSTHDRQANGNSPIGWLAGGPINASEVNDPVTPTFPQSARNVAEDADFLNAWGSLENTIDWNAPLAWVVHYMRNPASGGSCTPTTCSAAGAQCGSVSDGCGGTLNCGSCGTGETCNSNQCVSSGGVVSGTTYELKNVGNGQCMTEGPATAYSVVTQSCSGANTQKWIVTSVGSGRWKLEATSTMRALDAYGGSAALGTDYITWNYGTGALNRQFYLTHLGSDEYQLEAAHYTSGTRCVVRNGANGNNVELGNCGTSSGRWTFHEPGGSSCTPLTCAQAGAQCGSVGDGCGGNLSCGSCASGETCDSSNQCVSSCVVPGTPTGLAAAAGDASVSLNWNAASGTDVTYRLQRRVSGNTTWITIQSALTTTSYNDTGLTNGTTYEYRVRAEAPCGASSNTALVSATLQQQSGGGSEPCTPQLTLDSGETNSGGFGTTGAFCFRTNYNIAGWGCSNFDGRTVEVNDVGMSCGNMPLPTKHDGYYYFDSSGGSFSWASIYWW